MSKEIPALLKSPEIEFDGFQTQNFSICSDAKKLFASMIQKANEGSLINIGMASSTKDRTQVYVHNKPDHIKKQQFKQYLGL